MENFLIFSEEIRSLSQLSFPVNPDWEFCTISVDDIPVALFSVLASPEALKYFTFGKYTLTSSAPIAMYTILDILNEYKEEEIRYNMISIDDFKNNKLAEGFQGWLLEQQYLPFFNLINQSSKVLTFHNTDFYELTEKKTKNFEEFLQDHLSSFVEIENVSPMELHSPRVIKDDNRRLRLETFRKSASSDNEDDFYVRPASLYGRGSLSP